MPITDRANAAVLSTLTAGLWVQLGATSQAVEHGFDTLDVDWICDFRAQVVTALEIHEEHFPAGSRYGSRDFWLRSATPSRVGGNVWRVAAHYEGRISEDKPLSARFTSSSEVLQIDALTIGIYEDVPANVREASPSVELGYVLVDALPPTNLVGLAGTPGISPPVRAGFWGSLLATRINYPSGWLFEDMDSDMIAGAAPQAHYVKETWRYYHELLPS